MEDECYDIDLVDCADYPFDSFGGHTKAIEAVEGIVCAVVQVKVVALIFHLTMDLETTIKRMFII